ncbi:MAG TPA: sigma-70 family RNA polymerase sigma factor [Acidimicrobiales bacterium]
MRVDDLQAQIERHRRELTGYCYRMLGSAFEADDAVQETMLRAWKAVDRFEGRSSLRAWLYRIATNVCLNALQGRRRRARPVDLTEPFTPGAGHVGDPTADDRWLGPVPDDHVLGTPSAGADPVEVAEARESIRLAFVAALQHLLPRQRAVLILREVLRWRAAEVADVLGTTVASVNSSLQRARARLAEVATAPTDVVSPLDPHQADLLDRYVRAFERYDLVLLASLLHTEATLSLPPYETWMRGPSDICDWYRGPGIGCQGSRLVPIVANGSPAYGQYRPGGPDRTFEPWAIQVVELVDGRIAALNCFLDVERLFPLFGLPPRLDRDGNPCPD